MKNLYNRIPLIIEYWQTDRRIKLTNEKKEVKELISISNDQFGHTHFQIDVKSWVSINHQKRAKTLVIFLRIRDKYYKSFIPFNPKSKSFIFNDFREVKRENGGWILIENNLY